MKDEGFNIRINSFIKCLSKKFIDQKDFYEILFDTDEKPTFL